MLSYITIEHLWYFSYIRLPLGCLLMSHFSNQLFGLTLSYTIILNMEAMNSFHVKHGTKDWRLFSSGNLFCWPVMRLFPVALCSSCPLLYMWCMCSGCNLYSFVVPFRVVGRVESISYFIFDH